MSAGIIVTGTDTGVGKTVFAAALAGARGASYWKPVQCGLDGGGDVEAVRRLSGLPPGRILPEIYRFRTAASPHRAAELDGIEIDLDRLTPPDNGDHGVRRSGFDTASRPLVVEGAGGLMVPLTRTVLQIDLFARWRLPVVLVARTALGTINHSLLSIEALKRRGIPLIGLAFVGDENKDSERTICEIGGARRLGRLPRLAILDQSSLAAAFAAHFRVEDFA
ncbi:MAG TPA: dethiobiotin synthase [Hyphomicrobiaceae bacterium]|nr:dethiobiotin synthase [Hyphomicrobiaceae bacterium]